MWTRCPGTHRVCWLYHFLAVSFWGKLTSTCFHFLIIKLGIVKGLISQDCCANLITSIQQQPPPAASIITSVPYSSAIFPIRQYLLMMIDTAGSPAFSFCYCPAGHEATMWQSPMHSRMRLVLFALTSTTPVILYSLSTHVKSLLTYRLRSWMWGPQGVNIFIFPDNVNLCSKV